MTAAEPSGFILPPKRLQNSSGFRTPGGKGVGGARAPPRYLRCPKCASRCLPRNDVATQSAREAAWRPSALPPPSPPLLLHTSLSSINKQNAAPELFFYLPVRRLLALSSAV